MSKWLMLALLVAGEIYVIWWAVTGGRAKLRARREDRRAFVTWTCHACGLEREDARISVASRRRVVGRLTLDEHRRYCNDVPACIDWAFAWVSETADRPLETQRRP